MCRDRLRINTIWTVICSMLISSPCKLLLKKIQRHKIRFHEKQRYRRSHEVNVGVYPRTMCCILEPKKFTGHPAMFGIKILRANKLSNAVGDSGICLKLTVILVSKHNHGSFKYLQEKENIFPLYFRRFLLALS